MIKLFKLQKSGTIRIPTLGRRTRIVSVIATLSGGVNGEQPTVFVRPGGSTADELFTAVGGNMGSGTNVKASVGVANAGQRYPVSFVPATGVYTFDEPETCQIGLPNIWFIQDQNVDVFGDNSATTGTSQWSLWYEQEI